MATWGSWTTTGVYTGSGGAHTDEGGVITGDLTVHTTWVAGQAHVAVQYSGASEWYTMTGSPVVCDTEEAAREVHQGAVDAVRAGGAATVPDIPGTPDQGT